MNDSVYQQKLLTLAKMARPGEELPSADFRVCRRNPLCGDEILLTASGDKDNLRLLRQRTRGCILCEAAAVKMLEFTAQQPSKAALRNLCHDILPMFAGAMPPAMAVFSPVIKHPARYGCVLLPFEALAALLQDEN